MAKPEWGRKRICQSCGTKFYDLQRDPIVCPSCGASFDPEVLLRGRRSKTVPAKEKPTEKVRLDDTGNDDAEIVELDTDDEVIEDADDLGEDDLGVDVEDDDERNS